jgi:Gram-negative bacterial TonB protein C-terminal/PilZ domain
MSTATDLSRKPEFPRTRPRVNLAIALDVTVVRAGVADRIPGRSVDINGRGLGLVLAGEVSVGESVGVEFWLPRLEEPLKARAVVRHQHRLRCGVEFQNLSAQQKGLIHSWIKRRTAGLPLSIPPQLSPQLSPAARKAIKHETRAPEKKANKLRAILHRHGRKLVLLLVLVSSFALWRWQHGWSDIEAQLPAKHGFAQPEIMVPGAEMEQRITHKVDAVYPDSARQTHVRGIVLLHAIIDSDGTVVKLEPIRGPQLLFQSAMDAARWWRFEPYVLNGKRVGVETTLEIPFSDAQLRVSNQ